MYLCWNLIFFLREVNLFLGRNVVDGKLILFWEKKPEALFSVKKLYSKNK